MDAYKQTHRTHQQMPTKTQNTSTDAYKDTEHINRCLQRHRTHQQMPTNTKNTSTDAYKHTEHIIRWLQTHRTHQQMPTNPHNTSTDAYKDTEHINRCPQIGSDHKFLFCAFKSICKFPLKTFAEHYTLKRHDQFAAFYFYCKIMLISVSYDYCSVLTTNKSELTS